MVSLYNSFDSTNSLKEKIAEDISTKLKEKNNTLLLLSGGSALSLYDILAVKLNFDLSHVTISVLDERYNEENSNYLQLKKTTFYTKATEMGAHFFGIEDYTKTPQTLANEMDTTIRGYIDRKDNLIAIMGMGPDGHTSGMMPYPEDKEFFKKHFIHTNNYFTSYDAGDKNEFPMRITSTIPLLLKIDRAYAFILGENKAMKLKEALSRKFSLSSLPISVINDMKDVRIYTDTKIKNV